MDIVVITSHLAISDPFALSVLSTRGYETLKRIAVLYDIYETIAQLQNCNDVVFSLRSTSKKTTRFSFDHYKRKGVNSYLVYIANCVYPVRRLTDQQIPCHYCPHRKYDMCKKG